MFSATTTLKATSAIATVFTLFVLTSVSAVSTVNAGWTCCKAVGGNSCGVADSSMQCDGCSDAVVTKNQASCGPTCTQAEIQAGKCRICPPGTVSNVCGGSNPGSVCSISVSPSSLSVKVGETVTFNAQINQPRILRFVSSNTTIAGVSPSQTTASANTNYTGRVIGQAVGTTNIVVRGISTGAGYEQVECSRTIPVTVVKNDAPLACTPGAACAVVGGGAPRGGKSMGCTMPSVSAAVLANTNLRPADTQYQLKCDHTRNNVTRTLVNQIKISGATGTIKFDNFGLEYGGTYKCSFRYCLRNKDLTYNCSPWGAK